MGTTPIYTWDGADGGANGDAVVTPTLAVDTNLPSFTDPTTGKTQTDNFSGNIYVVWAEVDSNTNPGIPNFNPDTIRMSASSNQGVSFTHAAYVDNSSNAHIGGSHSSSARYSAPQVTISQGNGTVPGGQVTIVYDDSGSLQAPLDRILDQTNTDGGTSEQFSFSNPTQTPNINTAIPITVNITDPKFITLQNLEVTATIAWPNLSEIDAYADPAALGPAVDRASRRSCCSGATSTPVRGPRAPPPTWAPPHRWARA